jgi:hypothetical protein
MTTKALTLHIEISNWPSLHVGEGSARAYVDGILNAALYGATAKVEELPSTLVFTACAVWEELLSRIDRDGSPEFTYRANNGVAAMRDECEKLALWIERQWKAANDANGVDAWDGWAFDWEVVPAFLNRVQWWGTGAPIIPDGNVWVSVLAELERTGGGS